MTEVPKIVHQRLRVAGRTAEGAHPEADVLAAFAEQALSGTEREGVLEHLALCGDCRDVVALAFPAAELATASVEQEAEVERTPVRAAEGTPVHVTRWNWFAWANLRWAALAAGVAVAVLVARPGLERWAKPNPPASTAAKQVTAEAGPTAPAAQLSSGSAAERGGQIEAPEAETKPQSLVAKAGPFPAASRGREAGTLIVNNMGKNPAAADKLAPALPPAALAFVTPKSTSEAVEVSGAAVGAQAPASALDSNLMARNEAPAIEKAKPAVEEMAASGEQKTAEASAQTQMKVQANRAMFAGRAAAPLVMSFKPSSIWTIRAGVLERSLDGGQSWQTALKADHALLCYANRGQEVWTGGQAGTLMQSSDGGATWSAVKVSFKGRSLSSDVTRIDLRQDTAEIVLATAGRETWSSVDGGKTWEKK